MVVRVMGGEIDCAIAIVKNNNEGALCKNKIIYLIVNFLGKRKRRE